MRPYIESSRAISGIQTLLSLEFPCVGHRRERTCWSSTISTPRFSTAYVLAHLVARWTASPLGCLSQVTSPHQPGLSRADCTIRSIAESGRVSQWVKRPVAKKRVARETIAVKAIAAKADTTAVPGASVELSMKGRNIRRVCALSRDVQGTFFRVRLLDSRQRASRHFKPSGPLFPSSSHFPSCTSRM